jgi:hypothetical protein
MEAYKMADKKESKTERTGNAEPLEKHDHPHTHGKIPAPKFGSAGSGGAEFERLPEQHEDDDKIHES